jgi:hypothetical protein
MTKLDAGSVYAAQIAACRILSKMIGHQIDLLLA